MGRNGVASVAMAAAVISAASLGYAVVWSFQGDAARHEPPAVAQPATPAALAPPVAASPKDAPVAVIQSPGAMSAVAAPLKEAATKPEPAVSEPKAKTASTTSWR